MKAPSLAGMLAAVLIAGVIQPTKSNAGEEPSYLHDRGGGVPMSIFGTYVHEGELLVYPFYEYYYDNNLEYEPGDFGFGSTQAFRGRYRAHEELLFVGYGISDRVAIEFEASVISAKFDKSGSDVSALPARIEESGLGDVEGQVRWRWNSESLATPEFFNYFECVFPTGKTYSLIGTSEWELKLGTGFIRGFSWGTITARVALNYFPSLKSAEVGEYAIEYLKRLSERVRLVVLLEGADDEIAMITEIQLKIAQNICLKVNNGFGVTSKATDFAPEIGILFTL